MTEDNYVSKLLSKFTSGKGPLPMTMMKQNHPSFNNQKIAPNSKVKIMGRGYFKMRVDMLCLYKDRIY